MYLIISSLITVVLLPLSTASSQHRNLIQQLMVDYSRDLPPTINKQPVEVSLRIKLSQIRGVDQEHGVVGLLLVLNAYWYDGLLSWKPSSYENVTGVTLKSDYIWHPSLVVTEKFVTIL